MALLDFRRLRGRFERSRPSKTVTIILYSKDDDKVVLHSTDQTDVPSILSSGSALGRLGDKHWEMESLYVCIGKVGEDERKTRHNVKKAMKGTFDLLPDNSEVRFANSTYAPDAVYALIIGSYTYDFMKEKKDEKSIFLNAPDHKKTVEIAHAQNFARFLGDTPANHMTPTLVVEYAREFLEVDAESEVSENLTLEAHGPDFMTEKGMQLILSVSQGSKEEPRLLRVRYLGRGGGPVDVALVGKGVTFDSGGISLKPSSKMATMKHDMTGMATLLAVIKLAALFKIPVNLTGTFPLVENLPGPTATKPGDVFKGYSGKTVEVDNTDAEGRLILADALSFAQEDSPRYLIDAATLTGAIIVSLGTVYCGYFCNDEGFSTIIEEAAKKSDEFFWRMPLSEFYLASLKSHVADLVNVSGTRNAGSAVAAEFLQAFVQKNTKWVHFDIAGLTGDSFFPELYGKHATGRPVPGFLELVESLSKANE